VEPTHRCLEQQLISDVLFGYARGLPGAGLDDEGLIRVATQEFSGRAFRIVRGWMVLDVIADEGVLGKGSREMQQRTVLLVQHVVFDSEGKQSEWRVSSYGNHVDGCFFETLNGFTSWPVEVLAVMLALLRWRRCGLMATGLN